MKFNLPLRLKVTIINTIVLIICILILTIGTSLSATKSIDLISQIPPVDNSINIPNYNFNDVNDMGNSDEVAATLTNAASIQKEKVITISALYMIIVIVLGCIMTYLATKKSLGSIRSLSDEMKDISEHNLSKKIKEEGADDEIKDLTKSFNSMLSRIDDAFESQKQFSSNVAHELRTPLAVIRMKIDVFNKRKDPTIDDYKKLLEVVEKNNNRLSGVVEDLLGICNQDNIERNNKIDFNKIINSINYEFKEISSSKNIEISIIEGKNNINKDFYGNENLLYRAIYNLIENSIKYNNQNGYVKIYLNEEHEYIHIDIEDSGIGIKKEDYENIFKPFYRVDKSRSRKIAGSGIGLSIVKAIIQQHSGDIIVESDNSGSKFTIKMPYK